MVAISVNNKNIKCFISEVDCEIGSNDSRLHVVEPPRGRSFIWQIGVLLSTHSHDPC